MRLPTEDEKPFSSNVKEKEAIELIREAVDRGINYIDTAWPYHSGESEKIVGKALEDGYREKVKIATKFSWPYVENELDVSLEDRDDWYFLFDEQLDRLKTDKIDFYLLHSLDKSKWSRYKESGIFDWLEELREAGKIDYIGFSFHDDLDLFKEIVDYYEWDFCQIQYNYVDLEHQAGREGLEYASDKGLGVIVMEPLRGGELAKKLPNEVKEILDADNSKQAVELALKWLWNQPGVSLVLSGMSNLRQVRQNIEIAESYKKDEITEEELSSLEKARKKYLAISPVDCTGCNYCMPCPNEINIPRVFELYNKSEVHGEFEKQKKKYIKLPEKEKPKNCVSCGECKTKCPQDIDIPEKMEEITRYFNKEKQVK
ncbi:MAG: Aldo/keto reductase family protein [Candidatus Methanohalarchaeum thermophilum]|uniref:Aldo/keto reductase family protein n=1 Tax=Methanohalarchaeum thermophilum TaxID=1903181 RepID=A0A1Q6DT00_METT1|nr:MAG: Aldo/keto reductase family protein [Candidatus Methanohalarchaeum thermophilum]